MSDFFPFQKKPTAAAVRAAMIANTRPAHTVQEARTSMLEHQPTPVPEEAPQRPEDGEQMGEGVEAPPGGRHLRAATVVKIVGQRLTEARELTGLKQWEAAARIGITKAKLAAFEAPADRESLPLWVIRRAAEVYEVSIDYLFGAMDDWEVGARMTMERQVSAWMFREFDQARLEQMDWLRRMHDRMECLGQTVATVSAAQREAHAALERFAELNPEFEDMKAGAKLVSTVERAKEAAESAALALRRFPDIASGADVAEGAQAMTEGATA